MNKVKTLLKLEFRSRFAGEKFSLKSIPKHLITFGFAALIAYLLILGINNLTKMFLEMNLTSEYLTLVFIAGTVILIVFNINSAIKTLYNSGDNAMLLRYPVNEMQIFASKILTVFILNLLLTLALFIPIFIIYNTAVKAGGWGVLTAFVSILVMTFVPFSIANFIAIPVGYIANILKNKYFLYLIIMIAVVAGGFILYMSALQGIYSYMVQKDLSIFSPEIVEVLKNIGKFAYPFVSFAHFANKINVGLNIGILLGLTAVTIFLAFFMIKKLYFRALLKGIEKENAAFKRKTKNKKHSKAFALLKREYLSIIRSNNYSFQYFVMVLCAPIMTYYCDRFLSSAGSSMIGKNILPGLNLMIIIIFLVISLSFSSSAISREGNTFYHTKIIPAAFAKQLMVKLGLYLFVGIFACVASSAVCMLGEFVNIKDGFLVMGLTIIVSVGMTCMFLNLDLTAPEFKVSGDNEIVTTNKNISLSIIIGLILAIGFGLFAMLFSYIDLIPNMNKKTAIYLILYLVGGIFTAGNAAGLFVKITSKYYKISQ